MTQPTPWIELQEALDDAGLRLVDISRDSKLPKHRTDWSIQYLTDLRAGRRGDGRRGVDSRVLFDIAKAIGVEPRTLRRTAPPVTSVPETVAS